MASAPEFEALELVIRYPRSMDKSCRDREAVSCRH